MTSPSGIKHIEEEEECDLIFIIIGIYANFLSLKLKKMRIEVFFTRA